MWSFYQGHACALQLRRWFWTDGTSACLQQRREALDRSTVEGFTITFVFIHCALHATCSMERHDRIFCLKICWIIMTMEHCVAHLCFWIVVLGVHVCCKACIMLGPLFLCHWSIYFHRGLLLSYLSKHSDRLISCQGVQRLVSENQLIPESLNRDSRTSRYQEKDIASNVLWRLQRVQRNLWTCQSFVPTSWGCSLTHLETWWLWSCLLHVCVTVVSTSWTVPYSWLEYDRLFTWDDWCYQKESCRSSYSRKHHQMTTIQYIQISMVMFHQMMMMKSWVVMNRKILWMMIINLITILDQIQMMMMMKSTSFQMTMDHHLMMTWICQEGST